MNESDEILRALDRVAAEQLRPGLARRVLARRRRPAPSSWGVPAVVAAAACGLAGVLFWMSARSDAMANANLSQWNEMVDTAKDLAP
jgi:uncharacterized iron-regulated membrane protein